MSETTAIEWTDSTWTPVRARRFELQSDGGGKERIGWHCEHASPGCINCYAEGINKRLGTRREFKPAHLIHETPLGDKRGDVSVFLDEKMLLQPLKWKRGRMIFVCSMTDLFAGFVEDDWIDRVLAVASLCPQHTFQILTKRADRLLAYMTQDGGFGRLGFIEGRAKRIYREHTGKDFPAGKCLIGPLRNVWLGVSVEDQQRADERRFALSEVAARGWLTWVSYEPALTNVNWTGWGFVRWMVSGGESGPKARPTHPDWHRAARDYCAAHGIAYNFKQWGAWAPYDRGAVDGASLATPNALDEPLQRFGKKLAGRLLDGVEHNGFPA